MHWYVGITAKQDGEKMTILEQYKIESLRPLKGGL